MFDIVFESGVYVKYDMNNGRMLFNEGDFYAFVNYTEGNNLTTLAEIEQTILDRTNKLRNCLGFNGSQTIELTQGLGIVTTKADKVTTFIGKTDQTQLLKDQFGGFKHIQVGETAGSVNLLNMPDAYFNGVTWFDDYNRDWMRRAINRNDDIYIASPIDESTLYNEFGGSYFAKELNELILAGVRPRNVDLTFWNAKKSEIIIAAGTKY